MKHSQIFPSAAPLITLDVVWGWNEDQSAATEVEGSNKSRVFSLVDIKSPKREVTHKFKKINSKSLGINQENMKTRRGRQDYTNIHR